MVLKIFWESLRFKGGVFLGILFRPLKHKSLKPDGCLVRIEFCYGTFKITGTPVEQKRKK